MQDLMNANGPSGLEAQARDSNQKRLDRRFVHKTREENVFVSWIEPTGREPDQYLAQLDVDTSHAFFFEHVLDHVPGLMLMEAGRQVGIAVTHLFYDVPLEAAFVLGSLEVKFTRFAELGPPLFFLINLSDKQYRQERLSKLTARCEWLQNDQSLGQMSGRWSIYEREFFTRLRAAASPGRPEP
jgi:2-oxo-3-(phosphooxy)propyl 3-oxoalkanoate synthase